MVHEDNIDPAEALSVLESFLLKQHEDDIVDILLAENDNEHYAVHVNALDLFDSNMATSVQLMREPMKILPIFDQAFIQAQVSTKRKYETSQSNLIMKYNCHVRISNLPICPELVRDRLPKSKDVGSFVAVSGW